VILLQEFRQRKELTRVISGFSCEVFDNRTLLGYCVASSGNSLPTLRGNLSFPSSRVNWRWVRDLQVKTAYGADRLSRNVGKELPPFAALKTREAWLAEDSRIRTTVRLHNLNNSSVKFEWPNKTFAKANDKMF
jgi:hypothetical protein